MSDYVRSLQLAPTVETLLVPKVEVGVINVSSNATSWPMTTNTPIGRLRFIDVPITFAQPFAEPPQVVSAFSFLGWDRADVVRITAEPVSVERHRFILRISALDQQSYFRLTGASVTWTAAGKSSLQAAGTGGLASLGTPGLPPLVPSELREQARTPALQCLPQWADGRMTGMFNAIPGRSYAIESSSDLRHWSLLGVAVAEDFEAGFNVPLLAETPQQFFRVATQ